MSTPRKVIVATLFVLTVVALSACSATPDTSPPGPLGITGSGWFLIIVLSVIVLGGVLSEFADRPRRERRRRDRDDRS